MPQRSLQQSALGLMVAASLVVASSTTAYASAKPHPTVAEETSSAVKKAAGTSDVVVAGAGDADSVSITRTSNGVVHVPAKAHGAIAVKSDASNVSIGLPATTNNAGVKDSSGTVVYADASASTDVAVQPTQDGVRTLIVIKKPSAAREYRFPVAGPAGSRLMTGSDLFGADYTTGEVFLVHSDRNTILGVFDPAWAKDANGNAVPTSYRVEGRDLVQTISFTSKTAFPVVADPNWWAVAKCAGAIAAFVGGNFLAVSKLIKVKQYINALGGFRKSAELLIKAGTWEERFRVGGEALVGLAGEILGYAVIDNNC